MSEQQKGSFLTFEGPEGSGKSTVVYRVADQLIKEGHDVMVTREPGGSPLAEEIRNILLDRKELSIDRISEAFLFAAARHSHLDDVVLPALSKGKIVLCDRFIDSSMVYQGFAHKGWTGISEIREINALAIGSMMPSHTFYLKVEPQVGLDRIQANENREVNRLDEKSLEFHERVCKGYDVLAEHYSDRIITIDASQKPEQVVVDCMKNLKNIL